MKTNNKTTCDPCEQDFKHKVNELVNEGKAPSHTERAKREHEVKSAFGQGRPAGHAMNDRPMGGHSMGGHDRPMGGHSGAPKAKPDAAKHPAMTGAPKMKK